jgi:hypothetical protein
MPIVKPMTGNGVIVMAIREGGYSDNGHRYFEHSSLQSAKAEAHRLAEYNVAKFVVYVPVAIVERAPRTVEHDVSQQFAMNEDPIPFDPAF